MENNMIEAVREWFTSCPLIDGIVGVDQLDSSNGVGFSVNPYMSGMRTLKRYVDGRELRQLPFYLQSMKIWSIDFIDTTENLDFFYKLSDWVEERSKAHNLPDINGAVSVDVLSDGYLADAQNGTAVYQIQCRVTYMH